MEKLEHVGIAVADIDRALGFYRDILGLQVKNDETIQELGVRLVTLPLGDTELELLEGLTEESTIQKFIKEKGEGIHHLAFKVKGLVKILEDLERKGVPLMDKTPRKGVEGKDIAFLQPDASFGTLIELIEERAL